MKASLFKPRTRKQVDVGHWFAQTIESVFGLKEADFEGTAARTPRARGKTKWSVNKAAAKRPVSFGRFMQNAIGWSNRPRVGVRAAGAAMPILELQAPRPLRCPEHRRAP